MTNIEATKILMETTENKGWEWVMSRESSNHPDDSHMLYCVIINEKNEAVSYLFNARDKGFYHGHYFTETTKAMRHCESR